MTRPPLDRPHTPGAHDLPAARYLFDNLDHGVAHGRVLSAAGEPLVCELLGVNAAFTRVTALAGDRQGATVLASLTEVGGLIAAVVHGAGGSQARELLWPPRSRTLRVTGHRPAIGEFLLVFEDIDDWKKKEADLRFHESVLRETGQVAKVGGWSFDPLTGAGFWTDEVARIHDLDPAAAATRDIGLSFYTEESRRRVTQAIERATSEGVPYDLELELVSAAGAHKWVRTIGHPTLEAGRVVRVHGSFQDITDRKRIEQRLAMQHAVVRSLAEASSVAEALPAILESLARADRWDLAYFLRVDDSREVLVCEHAWARPGTEDEALAQAARGTIRRRGEGLSAAAWAAGAPRLEYVASVIDHPNYPLAGRLHAAGYQTAFACPIIADGQVLGVVCFLARTKRPASEALPEAIAALGRPLHLFLERKRAEEALVLSELRHRMLIEHASDGVFLVTPDGRYEEVNVRFAAIGGYTREEMLGRPFGGLVIPEERERAQLEVARMRAGGLSESEWHVQRRDGGVVEVEMRARALPDGRITGVLRDITRRKQAEADVRRRLELEAQLSKLAAATPGAMYSFRIGDDGKPYFPFASQGIEDLTGFTASQLAHDGDVAFSRIPPGDYKLLTDSIAESARTMSIWSLTFRHDHPVKGMRWLDGRSMPVREADGSVTWHGFMADVTERRELEEQLRQAQKMEAIGQLASGVAHDFNNLLTVIHGNASLLVENGTTVAQAAREITEAAERAAGLTQQLLLFSRKQEMRAAPLDLNDVVERMTKLLHRILGEDITLLADCSPRPVVVRADAGMIEQVLLNLAVNSRDAMPAGGTLTVTTAAESVWQEESHRHVDVARLRVADTGSGIHPDVLPRIFEPFFTTKDVGKGTGLGLATVYAIVRQHGGTIDVHSEVGGGTTFDIVLPMSAAPAREAAAETAPLNSPGGHETVLVVEDEPAVRQLVAHLLQRQGYRVLTAESGLRALDVFAEHRLEIDLLLTDMVMPDGLTGRNLATKLRAERPDLRVVYTSGYTADAGTDDFPLVRGENFIQKPYQPSELARIVRAALDR